MKVTIHTHYEENGEIKYEKYTEKGVLFFEFNEIEGYLWLTCYKKGWKKGNIISLMINPKQEWFKIEK